MNTNDDRQLRLDCMALAQPFAHNIRDHIANAQAIYNFITEKTGDETVEDDETTVEDETAKNRWDKTMPYPIHDLDVDDGERRIFGVDVSELAPSAALAALNEVMAQIARRKL